MTNQERELAALGLHYAEGIEHHDAIEIPSTGRQARKTKDGRWESQPWNDNYWRAFDSIVEAVRHGTRPENLPVESTT